MLPKNLDGSRQTGPLLYKASDGGDEDRQVDQTNAGGGDRTQDKTVQTRGMGRDCRDITLSLRRYKRRLKRRESPRDNNLEPKTKA